MNKFKKAEAIKELRAKSKLSQKAFAKKLHISPVTLISWELERTEIPDTIFLGVTMLFPAMEIDLQLQSEINLWVGPKNIPTPPVASVPAKKKSINPFEDL